MESIPGDLLAHADWVRRLARRLVRDAAAADDVVQETWLAALKARRAADAPLRPWLARVAANFARDRVRGDANRAVRERSSFREQLEPSAAETAERLEAQRLLVDALAALAEPYRTTVRLRYLDGLSAAAIARRLGVPAGTVRWRLKQGMDELRARLDARTRGNGDRSPGAWCLLLLPLLRRPPLVETAVALPSAALQGVLAMNALTKLGIAAAIVVTASVGAWIAVDRSDAPPTLAAPAADTHLPPLDAAAQSAESASALASSAVEEARRPAAPAPEPVPEAESPAATPASRLEARFLDLAGRPLTGVALVLDALQEVRGRPSDAEGRIVLDLDGAIGESGEPRSSVFRATRSGFATRFGEVTLHRGLTTYLGDLTLEPGGSVAGRVLGPDGAPAAEASVLITRPEGDPTSVQSRLQGPGRVHGVLETTTDADGSFRVDDVRVGPARAWASAPGTRWSASDVLVVPVADVLAGVELRLEPLAPEDTIEGRVVSPEGDPVPGAHVRYKVSGPGMNWSGSFLAERDGRFVHRLPLRGVHDITAHDREGRWTDIAALGVAPGTHDLVLQFPSNRAIEIAVRGEASAPIVEFALRALSVDRSRVLVAGTLAQHADGRARILVPAEPFLVEVRARGHGSAELGPFEPDAAPESLSCALERRAGVRGRVTTAGKPVEGARVALHEMADDRTQIKSNGFPSRLHPQPEDEARTDADGWYELDPSRPGSAEGQRFFQRDPGAPGAFAVLCDANGHALAEASPLEIDPIVGLDGIDFALVPGGSIEGHVRVAKGREAAGIIVAIDRTDGRARTQRVGPDGRFRFDRLTPGRWNVLRTEEEIQFPGDTMSWSHGKEPVTPKLPWNCTVEDGATTRFDLDLTDDHPCALLARVFVGGSPAAGWSIVLHPPQGSMAKAHPGSALDAGGNARVEAGEPGTFELELAPPARSERGHGEGFGSELRCTMPVVLARGDNSISVRIEVGSVRGQMLAPTAGAMIQIEASSASTEGLTFRARVRPDDQGRFELPLVLAGRARVSRMQDLDERGTYATVAEQWIDVPAGGTVDVALP